MRVWLCCLCSRSSLVPVSFPPPLVRLCRVWIDADGSVTVSYGCVGFLHLDVDTKTKRITSYTQRHSEQTVSEGRRGGGFK